MSVSKDACVYLVGAGPGDAELLTLKGKRLIEEADVIVYDQLANARLLELARQEARLVNVGKHAGNHTLPQDEINALLVREASEAKTIVRLKGGDPFIFGRGGEEAQYLREHGVRFEVVPGVTSAAAVPAYAGIPVTHRDETATVTFITGHEAKEDISRIPWDALVATKGTLVFLMGLSNLERIVETLMAHGADTTLPVAVISHGTKGDQVTVEGTLFDIAKRVRERGVKTPALIVVGSVADLRGELKWFEDKPLYGRRILVTRERSQAAAFASELEKAGAVAQVTPLIRLEKKAAEIQRLQKRMTDGLNTDWIVFTSSNGVEIFMEALLETERDVRIFQDVRIAAIGEKTKDALARYGLRADCVPSEYRAETLAGELLTRLTPASKVLLARAYSGRPVLAELLREAGHTVEEVSLYDTLTEQASKEALNAWMEEGGVLTLCSTSAVEAFFELASDEALRAMKEDATARKKVTIAAIGPVTERALLEHGMEADIVPCVYTTEHMIEAIGKEKQD